MRTSGLPEPPTAAWRSLFGTVFQQSSNPMALVDDQRRFIDTNTAITEVLGYARGDLLGQPVAKVLIDSEQATLDDEWRQFELRGAYAGERCWRRADGRPVMVRYAARTAMVDGQRLALYVAMRVDASWADNRVVPAGWRTQSLSAREREVIRLVALGRTSRGIAAELEVSTETVRTHVRNAMTKVGTRTRAQLVAMAMADGLI